MKASKQQSSTATSNTSIGLGETDGIAIVGNSGPVTLTDGGAIEGSIDLAGMTVETAAELTLGILDRQNKANLDAFKQAASQQGQAYQFAMEAGRSDVSTMGTIIKGTLIVVGILVAGVAMKGLKQ